MDRLHRYILIGLALQLLSAAAVLSGLVALGQWLYHHLQWVAA